TCKTPQALIEVIPKEPLPATRAVSGVVEDEVLRTDLQKTQHAPTRPDRASAARGVNSPAPAFRQESAQRHLDRCSPELPAAQLPDFAAREPSARLQGSELSIEQPNLFSSRACKAFSRAKIEQQAQQSRRQTSQRFYRVRAQ